MGLTPRPRPARLSEKLLQIRLALGLSQNEMLRRLGLDDSMIRSTISGYERGERDRHCQCYWHMRGQQMCIWMCW